MADKPSRALVFYGDGLARFISSADTHLHLLASRAICGLLSLPHFPPSENEDSRVTCELGELLDANEALGNSVLNPIFDEKKPALPTVSDRFMGMKAAIVTDNSTVKSLGHMLGFKVLNWNEIHDPNTPSLSCSELLKLLGFQDGKSWDSAAFDLIIAHVGDDNNNITRVDHLVGFLLKTAESESEIGSRLHLSVILSYGATSENDHLEFSFSDAEDKNSKEVSLLFPCQSYLMKAGKLRENVRQFNPMLVAQYQKGVTRMDKVESFSFREFIDKSGNLITPADRFIHEVAFKLWKAPKYGA